MSARADNAKAVSWSFDTVVGKGDHASVVIGADAGSSGADNGPIPEMPQGKWAYDLCSCFSRPISCCSVFWCGSCTTGARVAYRLRIHTLLMRALCCCAQPKPPPHPSVATQPAAYLFL